MTSANSGHQALFKPPGRLRQIDRVTIELWGWYFTRKEWAATLVEELKAADNWAEPDDGTRYDDHWLAALVCYG